MNIPDGPFLVGIVIGTQMRWFSPANDRPEVVAILDPAGELSCQPDLEQKGFQKVPNHLLSELQERLGQAINGCAAYLGQFKLSQCSEPALV